MEKMLEDFAAIDELLELARKRMDRFKGCYDIYELLGVDRNASYSEIESKLNEQIGYFNGLSHTKNRDLVTDFNKKAEAIRRVLRDYPDEYNKYLTQNDPRIRLLRDIFEIASLIRSFTPQRERISLARALI